MTRICLTSIASLAALLAAACAGGDPDSTFDPGGGPGDPGDGDAGVPGDGDGDTAEPAAPGGYVKLARFVSGADERVTGFAELYNGHTGPGRLPADFYRDFPVDHCFAVPAMPDEPSFYDYLDIGESIELTDSGGGAGITLTREMLINTIFYEARGLGDIGGRELDASVDGTRGRIRVPEEPRVSEPAVASGQVVFDGPLTFRWQPTGAARVFVILQQGELGRICRVADDGEFTVSGDHDRGVPVYGTAVFMALNIERVVHRGREVELVGLHALTAEYERR